MRPRLGRRYADPDPVFVDRSGGRRRIVGRIGIGVALLGAAYGAVLVVLALVGTQMGAPGQPLFDHLPRVMSGQSARVQTQPSRSTKAAVKPAPRTDTDSSTTAPTAGTESGRSGPESPSPTPTSAGPSPSSSPSSSPTDGGSSTASSSPSPSPSPTATSQGKSDQAPGASHRPTNKPGHPTHP